MHSAEQAMYLLRSGICFERQETFGDDREMLLCFRNEEFKDLSGDLTIVRKIWNVSGGNVRYRRSRRCWCDVCYWCWLRNSAFNLRTRNPVSIWSEHLLFPLDRLCL